MPKVSVIIPVYNVKEYLRRCLDCLVNQTLKDIEIILVDDCSTDGSLDILKEYVSKDERFKLITLSQNQGASFARNKGLEIATGEYLNFIDSDDTIDLNYYEELYKKAHSENLDLVKCSRVKIDLDGNITKSNLNSFVKSSIYAFTYEWTTAIFRASIIFDNNIKFPVDVRKAQDVVFLNDVVLRTKTYAVIDNVNYYYHKRENSLNANKIPIENIKSALHSSQYIIESINAAFEGDNIKDEDYLQSYYRKVDSIISYTMNQNDSEESKRLCIKKFLELFKQCKVQEKLKEKYSVISKEFVQYIENDDVDSIFDFFAKYNSLKGYVISTVRNNVKKDFLC